MILPKFHPEINETMVAMRPSLRSAGGYPGKPTGLPPVGVPRKRYLHRGASGFRVGLSSEEQEPRHLSPGR